MKRISLYPFALSALLCLAGCADEDSFETSSVRGDNSLVAVIEGQETDVVSRTAVDDAGRVTWIATDALGVYAEHTENALFSSTGSGASVVFKGNLSPSDAAAEWAYYPYDANAVVSGQTLSFTLPDEYTYTGNSNAPMLAVKGSEGNFEFKHLCGLLRITLGGGMPADADRFVISSVGDDAPTLSGVATVNDVTATNAILTLDETGSRSITYTLGSLASAEDYQNFFVPLPVGTYPKLQVAFYLKDKSKPEFTRTLSDLQVRRAVMTSMPILDWKTGEQFVLNENTIEITNALAKHVSVSPEDNTTLLYKVTAADEVPSVGRVIWSRVTEDFPYGFLGKVTKVTANEDGSYTVETGVAALSEAFDELYVDEEIELVPEEGAARSRAEEMKVFGFKITTEADIKIGVENEPIYAHGNMGLGYNFTASIILNKKQNVERASFTLAQASSVQLGLCLGGAFAAENKREHSLGKLKFQRIPLAYGLIQLTPAIAPHFAIAASGEIQNEATFSSETVTYAGAEYKNGEWKAGQNKRNKANGESPWSFGGHLTFAGKVSAGLSSDCEVMLYERDDMKISLIPELAAKLTGEVRIDETNSSSLEEILNNVKLATSFVFSGKAGIDASLLSLKNQLKAEISFIKIEFAKKEIYLLPFFKELLASLKAKEAAEAAYLAQINTEASREMLSKDTQIAIEVKNQNGEVVQTTTPVAYTGSTEDVAVEDNEQMAQEAEPKPIEVEIDNIQAGEVYEAYPVIYSPLLEDIVPEGKLELKSLTVTFSAAPSIRDQLIQLYKDTDGDNWTNNENWCSDKPIGEWYGIIDTTDALQISLPDNNLKGSITLSDERLMTLDVTNNDLTSINLSNCTYLKNLGTRGNNNLETIVVANCTQLTNPSGLYASTLLHLDAHGCTALSGDLGRVLSHNLEYVDLSDCNEFVRDGSEWYNMPGLKTLKLKNCTQLTELFWTAEAPLDTLDVSGCINLKELHSLVFSSPASYQLRWVDLSGCTSLEELFQISSKYPIEYLDISSVCIPNDRLELSDKLQVLKVNGTELQELRLNSCTNLHQLEWDQLKVKILNISGLPFSSLDMIKSEGITELYIRNCPFSSFNPDLYPALTKLECIGTQITTLDFSGHPELSYLYCGNNEKLSSLVVDDCQALDMLYCIRNAALISLSLKGCRNLSFLDCSANQLGTLDLQDCSSTLTSLNCSDNNISALSLKECRDLTYLNCASNQLDALDLQDCSATLTNLVCSNNNISTLSLNACTNLISLECRANDLLSLDLQENRDIEKIDCSSNQLKKLDVSMLESLKTLTFENNPLEDLNISNTQISSQFNSKIPSLGSLNISNTQISALFIGDMASLRTLKVDKCLSLATIYAPRTSIEMLDVSTCPNLEYLNIERTSQLKSLTLSSEACEKLNEVYALGSAVKCEIPDWFPIEDPNFKFYYEQRYTYHYEYDEETGEQKLVPTDKDYGWWYPGEPDSGAHRR